MSKWLHISAACVDSFSVCSPCGKYEIIPQQLIDGSYIVNSDVYLASWVPAEVRAAAQNLPSWNKSTFNTSRMRSIYDELPQEDKDQIPVENPPYD